MKGEKERKEKERKQKTERWACCSLTLGVSSNLNFQDLQRRGRRGLEEQIKDVRALGFRVVVEEAGGCACGEGTNSVKGVVRCAAIQCDSRGGLGAHCR